MKKRIVNARVEYEITPIRNCAIECPNCENWFQSHNISKNDIIYAYQLSNLDCR